MDFKPKQCLAITKAILKLTSSTGDPNLAERKARRGIKFKDTSLTYHESDASSAEPPQSPTAHTLLQQGRQAKTSDGGHWILIERYPLICP